MRKNNVQCGILLEIGDVKQINQDSVWSKFKVINKYNVGLFIVADGMGGHAYGEEVSNLAVTFFKRWWNEILEPYVYSNYFKFNKLNQMLEAAIVELNNMVINFSRQVNKKAGSTLSVLLVIDDTYFIKNVGDSRIYLIRKNKKIQLTQDQSLVAQMVRDKEITEEQAKQHSQKNILTMCLGVFEEIKTFSGGGKISPGDVFMLCSDGLYNYVDESEILPIIKDPCYLDFNQKAALIRSKIPKGSARDNISIILVKLGSETGYFYNHLKYLVELAGSIWKS